MDLRLTAHAIEQLAYRSITIADIEHVLLNPRWTPPTTRSTRYDGIIEGHRLAIVVNDDTPGAITIVTAFWPDLPPGQAYPPTRRPRP